jgi:hypothetical protein
MKTLRLLLFFVLYVGAVVLLLLLFESDLFFWTLIALAGAAFTFVVWRMLRRSPLQHNLHQLEMLRLSGRLSEADYARMRQALLDGLPASEVLSVQR